MPKAHVFGMDSLGGDERFEVERVRGPSGKLYVSTGAFQLRPGSEPRRSAIRLVESSFFDPLILLTILANCATMAWQSPLDPCCTWKEAFIDKCEWVFLGIFTMEMLVKILAFTFIGHKEAYLHDPWCQLDFLVVSLAWLPILFPSMGNYSVLRAFRALRPLRALKRLPGMPVLVQWILSVLPKMGNVLMLFGFIFLVFGIVGMELFKGSLHYRCALPGFVETADHSFGDERRALREVSFTNPEAKYDTELACSSAEHPTFGICPAGTTCKYFRDNPSHGVNSFDSVPMVFIIFIQAVTFDDWATPMYDVMASFSPYAWVYFIMAVVLAGFFVVNLFLAVIFLEFGNAKADVKNDFGSSRKTSRANSLAASRASSPVSVGSGSRPVSPQGAESFKSAKLDFNSGKSTYNSRDFPDDLDDDSVGSDSELEDIEDTRAKGCGKCRQDFGNLPTCLRSMATSDGLATASTTLVLLNVVLMCMPYYGMTEAYEGHLEQGATFISWLFIVEMFAKLIGLGCRDYWRDGWNCLDGSIVCLSIFEMLMTAYAAGTGVKLTFLRMLRMLRVLRILRLMRSWRGLYKILKTFMAAIPQMINLVFLIILTMFMFALLGMQLFGGLYNAETGYTEQDPPMFCNGDLCPDGLREKPLHHFDYCFTAMLTVFVLLTGEWIDAMEPVADILGPHVCVFFIFVVVLGKYLLMNLLIAVILNEFQDNDSTGDSRSSSRGTSRASSRASSRTVSPVTSEGSMGSAYSRPGSPSSASRASSPADFSSLQPSRSTSPVNGMDGARERQRENVGLMALGVDKGEKRPTPTLKERCKHLMKHAWFDRFIIATIIGSSITLALDSPRLDRESQLAGNLAILDKVFTGIFFCEMIIKIIALTFYSGKDAYIKSPWNLVDFSLVMISVLLLFADSIASLRSLRVLRVLRVLRPLRLISRNSGMKLIITSLFHAMPAVVNVFGVVLAMQIVFAILGMQLFSGTFASCSDPSQLTREACLAGQTGLLEESYVQGRRLWYTLPPPPPPFPPPSPAPPVRYWTNPPYGSFDNFGDSMRLLYIMSSADQWELPMYLMMGSSVPGVAPVRDDSSPMAIFALAWMFCGYIFAINIFVGVVVDNFSRMQREHEGSATMTPEQKQWADTMKTLASKRPQPMARPPEEELRKKMFEIMNGPLFDAFITGVIVANIAVMSCDYYGIEDHPEVFILYERSMDFFAFIYYFEATVKILALGFPSYISDNWTRFDFFLVCTSLVDQFATELLAAFLPIPPMLLRVLRVFRILRILRLLKGAKQLRDLIITMMLSFPSLLNVSSLLALIMFIYSILGVNLFTFVAHGDPITEAHGGINFQRNFDNMGQAILVLLQCLTSDGWSTIMSDAMIDEASGKCVAADGNCGTGAAVPYFVSYQIVGSFIFLNLVIAVILENFTTLYFVSPDLASASDIEVFSEAWQFFDPDATNYVPLQYLPELLLRVPRPLGVKGLPRDQALRLCLRLRVPQHEGRVEFREVLKELVENNFFRSGATELDEEEFKDIVAEHFKKTATGTPAKPDAGPPSADEPQQEEAQEDETETVAQVFAMAKMHTVSDGFMDWLARVRRRLTEKQDRENAVARAFPKKYKPEEPEEGSYQEVLRDPQVKGHLRELLLKAAREEKAARAARAARAAKQNANGHANGYANGHANGDTNGYANGHADQSSAVKTPQVPATTSKKSLAIQSPESPASNGSPSALKMAMASALKSQGVGGGPSKWLELIREAADQPSAIELVGVGSPASSPRKHSCNYGVGRSNRTAPNSSSRALVHPEASKGARQSSLLNTVSTTKPEDLSALELVGVGTSPSPSKLKRGSSKSTTRRPSHEQQHQPTKPSLRALAGDIDDANDDADEDTVTPLAGKDRPNDTHAEAIANGEPSPPKPRVKVYQPSAAELVGRGSTPQPVRRTQSLPRGSPVSIPSPRSIARTLSSPRGSSIQSPRTRSGTVHVLGLQQPGTRGPRSSRESMLRKSPRNSRDEPVYYNGSGRSDEQPSALELVGLGTQLQGAPAML